MWKILVLTEISSEKGAKRCKQIYCTSSGTGDIQEKRKVEKQGGCVFLLWTVYQALRKNFKNIESCFRRLKMKKYYANDPKRVKVYFRKHLLLLCKLSPKNCFGPISQYDGNERFSKKLFWIAHNCAFKKSGSGSTLSYTSGSFPDINHTV